MEFVLMDASHVDAVAQLEEMCFSQPWSRNSIASELSNPLSLWVVAVDRGTTVGYVGSQAVMEEADMMNLAVHPDYRRLGVGKQLVEALIQLLAKKGATSLSLEVRASNTPAFLLYRKLGFLSVGRRPGYYQKPKEDALILRKEWDL